MLRRTCSKCVLLVLLFSSTCVGEILVFGDSLSDTGNTYDATTSSIFLPDIPDPDVGYYMGRFSNGPVWIEHLAVALGEPDPMPSRLGGTNYSFGGSAALESGFLQPSLAEQVSNVSSVDASDWCVIWIGSTDLLGVDLNDLPGGMLTAQAIAAEIENNVNVLYSRGARKFIVLNIPALGRIPLSVARLNSQQLIDLNFLSEFLNVSLSVAMQNARQNHSEIQIIEYNAFGLFEAVVSDPAMFGLTNVTDSAAPFDPFDFLFPGLATALPPPENNVDEYLFYDGLHPTAVAHLAVGNEVAAVVNNAPIDVTVEGFNIFRGVLISGELEDVLASDDAYLRFNPGLTLSSVEPPVWIEFETTLSTDQPSELSVTLEAAANTVGLTQTIEMFNWNTNQYQQVDSRIAAFPNDVITTLDVTAGVSDFVQMGTGAIKSRTGWRATGPVALYPWTIRIDHVVWTFTQ